METKTAIKLVFLLVALLPYASTTHGAAAAAGQRLPRLLVLYRRGADGVALSPAPASLAGLASKGRLGSSIEKFVITDGQSVDEKIAQLSADPAVEAAEPDVLKHRMAIPDDRREAEQWAHKAIDSLAAWDVQTDASSVTVCVIDSGIDYTHPDLAPNVSPLKGNDYSDDIGMVAGTSADRAGASPWQDVDPMDPDGHGSHVAGIIGAVGNNRQGVAGIAWKVQLLACKIFDGDFGSMSALLNCYRYCRLNGANIMSASYAGTDYSRIEQEELQKAADAGQLLVVAAGNQESDLERRKMYPASYGLPNIIAVAASDKRDELAWYSSWGAKSVHLAAPGTRILSTWRRGGYSTQSGTSMAAPHVSGAAALVWAAAGPGATAAQVKQLLLDNVDKLPSFDGLVSSGGRLNVARAVAAAKKLCYTPRVAGADTYMARGIGSIAPCGSAGTASGASSSSTTPVQKAAKQARAPKPRRRRPAKRHGRRGLLQA